MAEDTPYHRSLELCDSSPVLNTLGERRFVSAWSLVIVGFAGFVCFLCVPVILGVIFWFKDDLSLLSVVCVTLGVVLFVRTLRIRLMIGTSGILVRNVFWTHRLAWSDVSEIGWRLFAIGLGVAASADSPVLAFKLQSGKVLGATATGGFGREKAHFLAETVQTLAASFGVPANVTADDLRGWPPRELPKTPQLR